MSKREVGGVGRLQSDGWRQPSATVSLPEVHGSVPIPLTGGFWRKMLAFAGPGYLVAVGYMDPGNWATDLAGQTGDARRDGRVPAVGSDRARSGDAVHRSQHSRRNRDAAQSLSTLVHHSDAEVRRQPGKQARGGSIRDDRFNGRAHVRPVP